MTDRWCTKCRNASWCKYIHPYQGFYCPGMEMVIDNKSPLKEPLASDLIGEGYEGFVNKDYKDVLGEVRESKDEEHRRMEDNIMELPDERVSDAKIKCISAALYFYVPVTMISLVFGVSDVTIYKIRVSKALEGD